MGLKGDIDEVVEIWKGSSKLLKTWLVLSVFLASGSIASLSETIIKWKGFFIDALNFYSEYFRNPILFTLEAILKYSIDKAAADVLILSVVFIATNLRIMIQFKKDREAVNTSSSQIAGVVGMAIWIFWLKPGPIYFEAVLIVMALLYLLSIRNFIKIKSSVRYYWLGYSMAPFLIVGLFGAINAGLNG